MSTYISAAYLLKDNLNYFYLNHNQKTLNESYLQEMSFKKQELLYNFIKEIDKIYTKPKINEDNFEYEMFRLQSKVEMLEEKFDFGEL